MQPSFPKRRSEQLPQTNPEQQRRQLIREIAIKQQTLHNLDRKVQQQQQRYGKVRQSNARQEKRILRYKARMEQMNKHKDSPQHFLTMSGYMNEYIQEYILSHNVFLDPAPEQSMNPDNMTYQQLIQLGDQIGRVSKGLGKEQIQTLKHRKGHKTDDACPVCQNDIEGSDDVIELKCGHSYHQDCILLWLKDQNTCPICKEYLGQAKGGSQKMLIE